MHRDEINNLVENSFVEHMLRKRKIRVHTRHDDSDKFTKWVDFSYSLMESPWGVLNNAGKYECIILEWLVNFYAKEGRNRNGQKYLS